MQELSLWHSWEQSFTDPILVVEEVEYFEILYPIRSLEWHTPTLL